MRFLVVAAVAAALTAGCMGIGGASTKNVSATDNQFTPNSFQIKQNDKVVWTNNGDMLHNVAIHKVGDGTTVTKKDTDIAKGASTDFVFQETGTFHAYCKYHTPPGQFGTGMVMTIDVS